jgi:hypothetical protein
VAPAIVGVVDARAVHDVAHPELVGRVEGEAAPVLRGRLVHPARHETLAAQQPMHGGRRQHDLRRHALLLARGGDHHRDTEGRVGLLERTELVGDGLWQGAHLPAVAPRLRLERVEAAAPVGIEPIAQRLGGHVAARAPGDVVLALGLVTQPPVQRAVARRQM